MYCFERLGIDATTDKKKIRHAYAEKVKEYHQETHPKEFERIRKAYEQAMEYAERGERVPEYQYEYRMPEYVISGEGQELRQLEEQEQNSTKSSTFFETEGFDKTYGNKYKEELRKLAGFVLLEQTLMSFKGTYEITKNYVMQEEFIRYQYNQYFIENLAELLKNCKEGYRQQRFDKIFLPFGIMYGLFRIDRIARGDDVITIVRDAGSLQAKYEWTIPIEKFEPLVSIAAMDIDERTIRNQLLRENVRAFSIAANSFEILSMGYSCGCYQPCLQDWELACKSKKYEIIPYVKIKNDLSFFVFIEKLINSRTDIEIEILIWILKYFRMVHADHSRKKVVYAPIVKAIETVTGIRAEILSGEYSKLETPEEYGVLLDLVWLSDGLENLEKACKRDAFLHSRQDEAFTKKLISMLTENTSYSMWRIFYEAYYFTQRRTRMEREVMDTLLRNTDYIEKYWLEIQLNYEEENENGSHWN